MRRKVVVGLSFVLFLLIGSKGIALAPHDWMSLKPT